MHRIITTGGPVYCRPRRLNPHIQASIKPAYDKLLNDGIVTRSSSPWCCPLHCVAKKDDSWRPTGDYRPLNNLTVPDTYPLPHLQSFTDHLHGKTVFSKIDLKDAFQQIPVHPDDVPKTTITTPFGSFQYHYMPFGLSGASQTFQRFIDTVLRDLYITLPGGKRHQITVFAYIDDILLASNNSQLHLLELEALFQRLTNYGLRINALKCDFGTSSMEFLGHLISQEGIAPLPDKVAAMHSFQQPSDAKDLRRYLGMINFYRRFVQNSAQTLQPLYDLIKKHNTLPKNAKIDWTKEQLHAFEKSKSDLANATLLAYPDPDKPLYLAADASDSSVAGVLFQKTTDNHMQPLGFFSRRLNTAQIKWTIFSRELLAVYLATKHFSYFLEGSNFTIQTDHQALVSAAANAKPRESAREVRHLQYITTMRPTWEFVLGIENVTADALSRATPEAMSISKSTRNTEDHTQTINTITNTLVHRQYDAIKAHQAIDEELRLLIGKNHSTNPSQELLLINNLFCVKNNDLIRIYIPQPLRNTMLHDIHDSTHPGIRTTVREAARLYYWPCMNKDVASWARACTRCQSAKIIKHNIAPPVLLPPSSGKFHDIHLDIVGPLTELKGMRYILTAVDRFSRWTMAEAMPDQLASTVADTFLRGWVQHHGVPHTITTDRGANFQSSLFSALLARLGSKHIKTTSYHPAHNGMIERWHRRLKDALRASADDFSWLDRLPLIMLNLHVAQRDDGQPSPAELVYGSSLTLPADLITPSTEKIDHNVLDYSHRLKAHMHHVRPIITRHNIAKDKKYNMDPALQTCSRIFLRKMNKTGLQDNYLGPFTVLERSDKYFTITYDDGKIDNVTIDRVKPCFTYNEALPRPTTEPCHEVLLSRTLAPQRPEPYRTRSGRIIRRPSRFMMTITNSSRESGTKHPEKGGDVAYATWHSGPATLSAEQLQFIAYLKTLSLHH